MSITRRTLLTLTPLLPLAACQTAPHREPGEWQVLFDGSDLRHWFVVQGGEWSIENGVLIGRNGRDWTTNPARTGSWLRTRQMYRDFELELEYAINEGGNSGVFFRSAAKRNPAFTGYEMQITDVYGKEANQYNAGIYDVVAPTKNVYKPANEWNHVIITAIGSSIRIRINGELVIHHEGDRRWQGYIGLQNHDDHSVVRFRNIRVREL